MTIARRLLAALFALLVAAPVFAQAQRVYSQPELDQMLAPIALYPDPLLSQVLMAATYPAEVAEAARWSRANPGLQGDDAVRAVDYEDWDPSVKSLVAFPQLLARMDENPAWTRSLGEAFLAQEPHVMDTVQQLRRRARAAGQLASDERLAIVEQSNSLAIQPVNPQVVYVPYYDPRIVYGPWWWPAYQPVYWAPWPRPYAIRISLGFFFGNFDWGQRQVRVVHPTAYYYRPRFAVNRAVAPAPQQWRRDPPRREALSERQRSRSQLNALPTVRVQPAAQVPAPVQAPVQPQVRAQAQPEIRPQAQVRQQPIARPQPQVRQEQRARMPEAVAPQQPRAERHEPRHDQRNERRHKG